MSILPKNLRSLEIARAGVSDAPASDADVCNARRHPAPPGTVAPPRTSGIAITPEKLALAVATANLPPSPSQASLSLGPLSNTGAQNTQGAILIDWLTFVVTDEGEAKRLRQTFGEESEWTEKSSGNLGYRRSVRNGGIVIYYDHNEADRGVCIAISGKGCRELEASGKVITWAGWSNLLRRLTTTPGVHLTRLDVAYDDHAGLLDMAKIADYVERKSLTSLFKSAFTIKKTSLSAVAEPNKGLTVNFGSRKSKMMSRFYDKAAEQGVDGHWVRCEIEAKDERAMELARLLSDAPGGNDGAEAGPVVAGVLRHYITFREPSEGDSNRSRWAESEWWLAFLGAVEKVRLAVGKPVRTWEKTRAWVEQQVAPALAVLRAGSLSWETLLADLLESGSSFKRFKPHHQKMVDDERARLAAFGVSNGRQSVLEPTGF